MTAAFYDDPAFLYGNTSRLYDEVPATFDSNRLQWRFEVAWSPDFVYFSETNGQTEAARAVDCYWNRGRSSFVAYDGNGLTRTPPGRMAITLSNHDGRYDPFNAASPLYPNVVPGKYMRLGVRRSSSTVYAWRFSGIVEDIRPYVDQSTGEQWVEITCIDGWGVLQDAIAYTPVSAQVGVSTAITGLLEKIRWPDIWGSNISNDVLALPYFWTGGDRDARTVLFDIAETQDGSLWIEGDGRIWYKPRTASYTSIGTFTQSDVLRDVKVENPWRRSFNFVKLIAVQTFQNTEFSTLWGDLMSLEPGLVVLDSTVAPEYVIPSGAELGISARYTLASNHPYGNLDVEFLFGYDEDLAEPVQFIYIFTTATDGAGTDVSGFVETLYFYDGGSHFDVRLKNNYSANVYSKVLSIFGEISVKARNGTLEVTADGTAGGAQRQLLIDTPYLIKGTVLDGSALSDIANDYLTHVLTQPRLPKITFQAKPSQQFVDLFQRFSFTSAKLGMSAVDFRVGYIEERWLTPTAQAVETVVQTEPYYQA